MVQPLTLFRKSGFLEDPRAGVVSYVAGLTLLLIWRSAIYGASLFEIAGFAAYTLIYILLPGVLLYRLLSSPQDDVLFQLGMGATLGMALQCVIYLLLKIFGIPSMFIAYPVTIPVLWYLSQRYARSASGGELLAELSLLQAVLLIGITGLSLEFSLYYSTRVLWEEEGRIAGDVLFHISNVAEFLHHWPLQDPRVAGLPFNYHILSFAYPAGASQLTGIPVADVLTRLTPGVIVALIVLQGFNLGREVFRSNAIGLWAALIIMFQGDVGVVLTRYLHLATSLWVGGALGQTIYESLTTQVGLLLMLSLAVVIVRWFSEMERADWWWRQAVLMGLFSFVVSGAKASIMPPVGIALVVLLGIEIVFRRRLDRHVLLPVVIVGAASLPLTYLISSGDSFAGSMLSVIEPGSMFTQTGFYRQTAALLHIDPALPLLQTPPWFSVPVTLVWLIAYLGLTGIGAAIYVWYKQGKLNRGEWWLALVFLCALPIALIWGGLYMAQRQILYGGQFLIGVLAAAAVERSLLALRRNLGPVILLLIALTPIVLQTSQRLENGLYNDYFSIREHRQSPELVVTQYLDGMAWLRKNTPTNAILVTNHHTILASAYAERRVYYETGSITPRGQLLAQQGINEPYPERIAVLDAIFAQPTPVISDALAELGAPVYVIYDHVVVTEPGGFRVSIHPLNGDTLPLPSSSAILVFSNQVVQIFRLVP